MCRKLMDRTSYFKGLGYEYCLRLQEASPRGSLQAFAVCVEYRSSILT